MLLLASKRKISARYKKKSLAKVWFASVFAQSSAVSCPPFVCHDDDVVPIDTILVCNYKLT